MQNRQIRAPINPPIQATAKCLISCQSERKAARRSPAASPSRFPSEPDRGGHCAEYAHQLGEWLHCGQDRGGEGVDLEQRRGAGGGLDMRSPLFRDGAAGCLVVG
jgi:hypothetical protein